MKSLRHSTFAILGLLLMVQSAAHATQVLEGHDRYILASNNYGVQVIQGSEVEEARPPVPQRYAEVAGSAAPVRQSATSLPSIISTYNRRLDPMSVSRMAESIDIISNYYHIDSRLLASLVAVESSFNPVAISSSGAIGLGQLKPDTARWLGIPDPYDPVQNLVGAAKYLRFLLDRYNGSVHHALAAYFQGQGTIDKRGIDTNASYYISKIAKVYNRF